MELLRGGGNDTLDFSSTGAHPTLTATRNGNDIKFSYSESDYVVVANWFSAANTAMQVRLPSGELKSIAEINAGFTTTSLGWSSGVFNTSSTSFRSVVTGLNSNFAVLDSYHQGQYGDSYFGPFLASGPNSPGYDTGRMVNGQHVYHWGAGLGNQFARPGVPTYAEASWDFWADGNGGANFVITSAFSGTYNGSWVYSAGYPEGTPDYISRFPNFSYSNPMHLVESTQDSFTLYGANEGRNYINPHQPANDFALLGQTMRN